MKYTSGELMEYIFENKMEYYFLTAIFNNDKEFCIMSVKTQFIKQENRMFFNVLDLGNDNYQEIMDENFIKTVESGTDILSFVSKLKDDCQLHFLILEEMDSDSYEIEELKFMIQTTLDILHIDTKGKVKAFIEKGHQLFVRNEKII